MFGRFGLGRRRRERDLEREIRDHLDLEAEALQEAGLSSEDARRRARLAFGNVDAIRDDVRDAWGWARLERLVVDVRHAFRLWTRTPGLSTIAVLTVALGIGASTAIFNQIDAVFWTPLPVDRPEELRVVAWTAPRHPFVAGPNVLSGPSIDGVGSTFGTFSYPAYVAMRDGTQSFSDLACWANLGESRPVILGNRGFGVVQFVSGNYLRTLGVPAALGRTIQPDDDRAGVWAVAMLSHSFWQRAFGSDPDVTRQTLRMNGRTFAIIGILPDRFFGLDQSVEPDVIVPIHAIDIATSTANVLPIRGMWAVCHAVGRLKAGISAERARIELEQLVGDDIATAPPPQPYDPPRLWLVDGSHGLDTLRAAASIPLTVLLVVVGALMLAACANIAGLLLARGNARQKEIATRLALGAPRARIVRQLITESLVLSGAGGVLGLLFAYAAAGFAPALLSRFMPTLFGADRALNVAPAFDARVLGFSVSAALIAGAIFGIAPAFRATRVDLMAIIKQTAARTNERRGWLNGGQMMVAAQTALAVLLLAGAGLLLRTVVNLRASDLGFDTEHILYARVEPRSAGLPREQRVQFFDAAADRIRRIPGVVAASAITDAPMGGAANPTFEMEGRLPVCTSDGVTRGEAPRFVRLAGVRREYFETMGMPLIAGRDFSPTELAPESPGAMIVNESFARAVFPGKNPVGEMVGADFASRCTRIASPVQIVGVVADTRARPGAPIEATAFATLNYPGGPVTLIIRAAGDPAAMIPAVRDAVKAVNADVPTFSEATLGDLRERSLRRERLLSDVVTIFGAITAIVCCLGIYGTLSYSVTRRRSEISVRMAIGARAWDVIVMIIRESLYPVTIGIVVGCGATLALARWLESMLFGISGRDPLTLVAAAVLFLVIAITAAVIPARCAARVDPVLALRQ